MTTRGNILVYVMDCLRSDRVARSGDPDSTRRTLGAFARESVVFEQAFAQATWTYPSAASFLSGLYPSALGIRSVNDPLSVSAPWLPEVLGEQGNRHYLGRMRPA